MGKPTGFIEYKRVTPPDRSPKDRINDWDEFHEVLSEENMKIQAARCMDCGTPFCHSGIIMNGMVSGCPLNNLIPEWNDLLYRGLWHEAYQRLTKTNDFPEFTGKVCPAPCEGSCTLGINNPQVTIKNNECSIIDMAFESGWIKPNPPKIRTGKKVAVIGSGPSGLACANRLNKAGHTVTVFERSDRIGGLLMYGIPNMKLDKGAIMRREKIMAEEGIIFKTNTEVGKDYSAESLKKDFDAAVLCCGSTKPRALDVKGKDSKGIYFAVDFLSQNTKSLLDSNHKDGNFISAKDKDVIIIGGGDTGTDCVATSLRHKCKSVTQFEIVPAAPTERSSNNPWPEWPKLYKTDYGQEEAIAVFGHDPRHFCINTKKIVSDRKGNVKEVHTVEVEWKEDDNGRFIPVDIKGTEKIWPAQLVLIAMGFLGPEDGLLNRLGIKRNARSNIDAEYGKFETNIPGIFSAGDARRGQSLVVWAIHEGRLAAKTCDEYLMGK
jgi:glutamate synthase (NADPH/NADH) small chain